jgi:hypothetical protein
VALSLLGSATCSVPDFVRTDLRTMRLAIAAWEEGASWRAQGWAGENGDRSDRAMHPSQAPGVTPSTQWEEGARASLEGPF